MDNQPTSDLWTTVTVAAEQARRRLQRRSNGWWRDEVAPRVTRADRVHALIETIAALDPTGRGAPPRPDRDATLADHLAVVAYDARLAAEEGHEVDAETVLRELARGLRDVDPRT